MQSIQSGLSASRYGASLSGLASTVREPKMPNGYRSNLRSAYGASQATLPSSLKRTREDSARCSVEPDSLFLMSPLPRVARKFPSLS